MSCQVNVGSDLPTTTTVAVTLQSNDWKVSPNPIRLKNDADEVCWEVGEVVQHFTTQYQNVDNIEIRFFAGPSGYDVHAGPFKTAPVFNSQNNKLTVAGRTDKYGDCYRYNIWVWLGGTVHIVHPIDPEVDNLMPPIPPRMAWLRRLWRLWLAMWRAILAMLRRRP